MGKAGQRFRTFAGRTSTANTKLASLDLPLEINEKAPRCHPNATLSPLEAPEFRIKSEANGSANAVVPAVPCFFRLHLLRYFTFYIIP